MKKYVLTLGLTFMCISLVAQHVISGIVSDTLGVPIPGAAVYAPDMRLGTSTASDGTFRLKINAAVDTIYIKVSSMGYASDSIMLILSNLPIQNRLKFTLRSISHAINEVYIKANQRRINNIERLNVRAMGYIPNISGSFESWLKSMPGVASANELSSQYSVRGGNFDENLVYVNGIEIFRPFLVRAGRQEGLSFVNPDLVEAVKFSAGAFDAEYGDKMSSVLDVQYRVPQGFATRASVSLLGASAATEGLALRGRMQYIMGIRYKTSRYMLNTLDSKGDYSPSFIDWQGLFSIDLTPKLRASVLGNYASNRYQFVPTVRETRFGAFNNTLQLKVFYEGQEVDRFQSGMAALNLQYQASKRLKINLYTANYLTHERETFDLLGQYFLNELDNHLGSSTYTDSLLNVGIGGFLNHARNYLDARIHAVATQGSFQANDLHLKWGAMYQRQVVADQINEWDLVDSSGYSLPYDGSRVGLNKQLNTSNKLNVNTLSGFCQLNYKFELGPLSLVSTLGARLLWWDYGNEYMFSPRASITVIPLKFRDLHFHLAGGIYYQPPFYKELRKPSGVLNRDVRAQKSGQLLLGANYYFSAWDRPFRLSLEAYYKWLDRLIPYKIDNVRIEYAGANLARGYARGVDLKLNGEMVPGAESWLGLSLLQTQEDVLGDAYGPYRRPTDQRFGFSLFFQDYLPENDRFKVHLSAFYGSGLPGTVYGTERYGEVFQMPEYRRVDIGFTAGIYNDEIDKSLIKKRLPWLGALNLGVEIFNLFNFNNTVSYLWVRTVGGQNSEPGLYAVPNYLTSRRFNLKLSFEI